MAAPKRALRSVGTDETPPLLTPWGALGFASERDMLLDDFQELSRRLKSDKTTATAVAALSKRKQEIFELIARLDSGEDDPDSVLDESEDEAWDGS